MSNINPSDPVEPRPAPVPTDKLKDAVLGGIEDAVGKPSDDEEARTIAGTDHRKTDL